VLRVHCRKGALVGMVNKEWKGQGLFFVFFSKRLSKALPSSFVIRSITSTISITSYAMGKDSAISLMSAKKHSIIAIFMYRVLIIGEDLDTV